MEKLQKFIARFFPAMCMVFLLFSTASCVETTEEWRYQNLKDEVRVSDLPEDIKSEILAMSFKEFIKKNPLKREIEKFHAEAVKAKEKNDSIWNNLIPVKEAELEPVREKYRNKTEILRIKRIWLNGDQLPWTYNAWLSVSYNFYGNSRHSGIITPKMYGHAKYTGENKLDYVNVVFSDNSYKRFLIKDNPEWLLAREGEKVERRYTINDYQVGTDVGRVLEKDAFSLVVCTEYVPLFK